MRLRPVVAIVRGAGRAHNTRRNTLRIESPLNIVSSAI